MNSLAKIRLHNFLFKAPYIKHVGGGATGFLWGHEIF